MATSASRKRVYGVVLMLGVLIAVSLPFIWRTPSRTADAGPALNAPATATARVRRETRPTLDPARFVGKAALAHRVAREIPDVLDQLYCYCQCDKHAGHKSLLSCYTDGHAAT
jgi:hypothetical protein